MGFLRTYLAIAVVLGHTSPILGYFGMPPDVAVRVFFIISGFYMALICSQKYTGTRGLRAFYIGRVLRIYPLFYLAFLFALGVNIGFAEPWSDEHLQFVTPMEKFLLFLPNLTIFGSDIPFLLIHDIESGWHFSFGLPLEAYPEAQRLSGFILNGPSWTLGNELAFYLLVPFISRLRSLFLALIAAASLGLMLYLEWKVAPWSSYFFFPSNLVFFVAGMLCYRFYASRYFAKLKNVLPARWLSGAVGIAVLLYVVRQYIPGYRNHEWMVYLLTVAAIPWFFERTKKSKVDRFVGEFSYPIYILHAPLML